MRETAEAADDSAMVLCIANHLLAEQREQAYSGVLVGEVFGMFERQIDEYALDRPQRQIEFPAIVALAIIRALASAANASGELRCRLRENWSSKTISASAPRGVAAQ